MESKLWKVAWKRSGQKYLVSLTEHPEIKASGASLDEATEKLEDLVAEKLGDPVPHFEFITPLPLEGEGCPAPYIHILTGHRCADGISNMDRLFVNGKCAKCRNYSGPRTQELIRLDSVPDGDLTFTDYLGLIISAKLADFLKLQDSVEITMHPVILFGKESSDFFELVSAHPREYVAIKGVRACKGGFKCDLCGFMVWMYMPYEAQFFEYISQDSLPESKAKVFPVGVDCQMRLAVNNETRASVIRSNKFGNIVSRKVGVLTRDQAVPISLFFKK